VTTEYLLIKRTQCPICLGEGWLQDPDEPHKLSKCPRCYGQGFIDHQTVTIQEALKDLATQGLDIEMTEVIQNGRIDAHDALLGQQQEFITRVDAKASRSVVDIENLQERVDQLEKHYSQHTSFAEGRFEDIDRALEWLEQIRLRLRDHIALSKE
jgi:ribosomal protein S15P/S13E